MGKERKPCIFGLHSYCIVEKHLREHGIDTSQWGTVDWIKLYCSMCIKAAYARTKVRSVKHYTVVNTL